MNRFSLFTISVYRKSNYENSDMHLHLKFRFIPSGCYFSSHLDCFRCIVGLGYRYENRGSI